MSKLKKDKLEDFFDKRIKKQSGSEGWNLPSDDIFIAAMETLDAEKEEKKSKALIYLVSSLLLIALSIYLITTNNKFEQIHTADFELKEKARKTTESETRVEDSKHSIAVENQTISEIVEDKSVSKNEFLQTDQEIKTLEDHSFVESSRRINYSVAKSSTVTPRITEKEENAFAADKSSHFGEKKEDLQLNAVAKLKPSSLSLPLRILPHKNINIAENLNQDPASAFTVFAQGALFQSSIMMKDVAVANFTLEGYERFSTGFSVGLGIQKNLNNKFKLETGINWLHFSNTSLYTSAFEYDEANTFLSDSGELMYHNHMQVNSPRARITMTDDIAMENHMVQNERITNKTKIVESYNVLQLGIGLNYEILSNQKWSIDLGLAPGFNFIFKNDTGLNTELSTDHMHMASYESNKATTDIGQFNKVYYDLKASLNINYTITDNWDLRLSGLFGQSLNSLKQFDNQDSAKSYFKTRSLALGLVYKF